MAKIINGLKFFTTAAEVADFHLLPGEVACHHCGEVLLAEPQARLFKDVREAYGHPIGVNSGHRCHAYQKMLYDEAVRVHGPNQGHVAHPDTAPHVLGVALDNLIPADLGEGAFVKLIDAQGRKLFGKPPRIGHVLYRGQGFVHYDVAFLLNPNPDPVDFQPGVSW